MPNTQPEDPQSNEFLESKKFIDENLTSNDEKRQLNEFLKRYNFVTDAFKVYWLPTLEDSANNDEIDWQKLVQRWIGMAIVFLLIIASAACSYFFVLEIGAVIQLITAGSSLMPVLISSATLLTYFLAQKYCEETWKNSVKLTSTEWNAEISDKLIKIIGNQNALIAQSEKKDIKTTSPEVLITNIAGEATRTYFEVGITIFYSTIQIAAISAIIYSISPALLGVCFFIAAVVVCTLGYIAEKFRPLSEAAETSKAEVQQEIGNTRNPEHRYRPDLQKSTLKVTRKKIEEFQYNKLIYYNEKYPFDLVNSTASDMATEGILVLLAPLAVVAKWSVSTLTMTADALIIFFKNAFRINEYHTAMAVASTKGNMVSKMMFIYGAESILSGKSVNPVYDTNPEQVIIDATNASPDEHLDSTFLASKKLTFKQGIHFLYTPSGSGKSTLAEILLGTKTFNGVSVSKPGNTIFCGSTAQDIIIDADLTLGEYLLMDTPLFDGFYGGGLGHQERNHYSQEQRKIIINHMLNLVDLLFQNDSGDTLDRIKKLLDYEIKREGKRDEFKLSKDYSVGQKQRLSFITFLMKLRLHELANKLDLRNIDKAGVIILDEVSGNISGIPLEKIYDQIDIYSQQNGSVVFINSHQPDPANSLQNKNANFTIHKAIANKSENTWEIRPYEFTSTVGLFGHGHKSTCNTSIENIYSVK